MIGPEGAADRVVEWLTPTIPARLRLLEARLGLDPATLPDPQLIAAQERGPLGLEDWPSVFVLPQRLDRLEPIEQAHPAGGESYRATYVLRVLVWVRAEGYDATDTLRKRYVLAAREALLERKQLAAQPAYGTPPLEGTEFAVVPASIREDYSDVLVDDAKRTIAGAWIDLNVTVVEVLAGPAPMGTVDTPPAVTPRPVGPAEQLTNIVVHPGLL